MRDKNNSTNNREQTRIFKRYATQHIAKYIYLCIYIFSKNSSFITRGKIPKYTQTRDNAKNLAANPNTSVYKHRRVPGICVDCKQ